MKIPYLSFSSLVLIVLVNLIFWVIIYPSEFKGDISEEKDNVNQGEPEVIRFAFVGDICPAKLGEPDENLAEKYLEVASIIRSADVSVGNLECAITGEGLEAVNKGEYGGGLYYRCSPEYSILIRDYGFDVMSLANNHTMDFGWEGLIQTKESLNSLGIKYVGAGDNLDVALEPLVLNVKGIRIAFIAIDDVEPSSFYTKEKRPGVAHFDYEVLGQIIENTRKGVDILICTVHWGIEDVAKPLTRQRYIVSKLSEWKVDIIIGSHPHILGPVEMKGDCLIAYSMGNFLFDSNYDYRNRSAILIMDWSKG
jgi:poly-gamma-glutamate synthesis protein (capsule biosynthesis protein)